MSVSGKGGLCLCALRKGERTQLSVWRNPQLWLTAGARIPQMTRTIQFSVNRLLTTYLPLACQMLITQMSVSVKCICRDCGAFHSMLEVYVISHLACCQRSPHFHLPHQTGDEKSLPKDYVLDSLHGVYSNNEAHIWHQVFFFKILEINW